MLTDYIKAAMKRAKYEIIDDNNPYYGEIPDLSGCWANGATLEGCRDELEEVVEGWIILGLRLKHKIPMLDGLDLTPILTIETVEVDQIN
ncbi:MAG: type II toxin-antitoxin system HicB family antitoxin [Candidatus Hatepunaea meridiana]|nr:type II toxin-antitoxin system HicB family antitoxin [Candidatus Hatepunaea meridiana]